jgi:hypothetical protein
MMILPDKTAAHPEDTSAVCSRICQQLLAECLMSDVEFAVLNRSQCEGVPTFRLTVQSPYSQRMWPEGNVTRRVTPDFH